MMKKMSKILPIFFLIRVYCISKADVAEFGIRARFRS